MENKMAMNMLTIIFQIIEALLPNESCCFLFGAKKIIEIIKSAQKFLYSETLAG